MKIDVNPKALGIMPISDDPQPQNGQTALNSEKAMASALVRLSPLSERLHALGASLSDSPAPNAKNLEEIKQAIQEGRFQVNPEAVADRLIDTVRELLRSHKA
jgi:negative regulator of flagellin synthesis FlgM